MEKLQFKTNIKCGGCIATVKPHLDNLTGVESWDVDTQIPSKILSVFVQEDSMESKVIGVLKEAGFTAELI